MKITDIETCRRAGCSCHPRWHAGRMLDFRDGHVARLTGPGLGIDVDEAAVRRAAEIGHAWRSPLWRYDDGSFAEW